MEFTAPQDLGEQCEENCEAYHLSTFAPPACCQTCENLYCCSCNCNLSDDCCNCKPVCNTTCTAGCQRLYQRLKHIPKYPSNCTRISNYPRCCITPVRRQVFRPIQIFKTECQMPNYTTIYRKSYDVPTCHLPSY